MDKKTTFLLSLFVFLVFLVMTLAFFRYIVLRDILFYTVDEVTFQESLSE